MTKMVDLWPDFLTNEIETNNAVDILREQARLLEKKTNKKVKATISKVLYSTSYEGLAILGKAVASMTAQAGSEIFEDELAEKQDMNDLYRVTNYKFEIFNSSYRFRVFTLHNRTFFPIHITLDEGIKNELGFAGDISIDSDNSLKEVVSSIFSTLKMRTIISKMMADEKK